ncbi:MAG: putative transporter [Bacteriovoracaceae bacterium]|nr:putative transporter [Bacteriovoracaceae bacterium]
MNGTTEFLSAIWSPVKRQFSIVRALRHRNYRLFFGGQSVSLIGTWLTRVATSWLVYRLTHSALLLGVVSFAGQFPTFLLSPIAGVLVDRWNRYKVLVITQILSMLQSAALAVLTLMHIITIPEILALSILQGLINAFDMPSRQALVVELIEDRKDLPNAIALNSSMVNMARLVGPSVAGILIATTGEGGCFTIDAISYLAVIASLLMMKLRIHPARPHGKKIVAELSEGFQYVRRSQALRSVLSLLGLISLMGMPYMVLLPIVTSEQLHGGPYTLGYLTAASGLGALIGVLYLASRNSVIGLARIIAGSSAVFGMGIIVFSFSHWVWLSFLTMFISGMGMMVQMAASNTILQTIVDEDKRGRVMSYFTLSVVGMTPFGSLLSGVLAEQIGATRTILLSGFVCLLGAIVFLRDLPRLRESIRPIYRRLGILPQISESIERASELNIPPEH